MNLSKYILNKFFFIAYKYLFQRRKEGKKGGREEEEQKSELIDFKDILDRVFHQCLSFHCNISIQYCLETSSD